MRFRILVRLGVVTLLLGCSSSETSSDSDPGTGLGGSGGQLDASQSDGAAGSAGAGGAAGSAGASGTGGVAGNAGALGSSGAAGATGGGAGAAGSGGSAGTAGAGGGATGDPCTSDADCNSGSTCQVLPNATQTALELQCAPIVGPNGTGIDCSSNTDCRSGQCIQQKCSSACVDSDDCTHAGSCQAEVITIGSLSGTFTMCVVEPCGNTAACDPGEYCSEVRTESGSLVPYCRMGNAGGEPNGEACTTGADCASLSCPTWLGFCTEVCSSDADCVAASDQGCVDMFGNGSSIVTACAPVCDQLADCPTGSTCAFASDSINDLNRFICGPGWGTDPVGSDCMTTQNCASGLCLTNKVNGQVVDAICTAPCVTGADCPTGFQVCADVTMGTPSGSGSQILHLCNHP